MFIHAHVGKRSHQDLQQYRDMGIKRSKSTNAHNIKENQPMRVPMADTILNSDN
jgi:hypothetical protein